MILCNDCATGILGKKNSLQTCKLLILLVPGAGVEPAHPYEREILSLLCLPISPPGRIAGLQQIAVRILTP